MPLPEFKTYTIDDIYALPEGRRAELIDGRLYDMAPPGRKHQDIVSELVQFIGAHIKAHGGNCKIYPAPFAVFLNADDKTYVEPDISVICDKEKLDDRGCSGAPDLIIEVVSPTNAQRDYIDKLNLYSRSGVREYWISDPEKEFTLVYNFEDDLVMSIIPFSEQITSIIFEDLNVNISELILL